jgi:hypothetical protein
MYKKPKITVRQWPPNNGCEGSEIQVNLYKGVHIDRFGTDYGFFFGVPGEPFIYRSLPWFGNYTPNDQNNNDKIKQNFYVFYSEADTSINPEYDYHLYKVIKPFTINSCTIKSAFGFPGGGTQYRSDIPVKDLIQRGFISEVPWDHQPLFDDKDINVIGGRYTKSRIRKRKTKRRLNKKLRTRRK